MRHATVIARALLSSLYVAVFSLFYIRVISAGVFFYYTTPNPFGTTFLY